MFYDEQGRHVRTKKEILDENGEIRKGCKIVKKGEIYKRNIFTAKNKLFKQENFVDEVKYFYTDLINLLIKDEKEKLYVFDNSGLYLATKKIGKNNPKAEQIQADNEMRMRWNREVDRAIVSGVAETEIQQIKKEYITDRIRESLNLFGNKPERLGSIIMTAVAALALLVSKVLQKARELSARLFDTETVQPPPISEQERVPSKEPPANLPLPNQELEFKVRTTERKTPQIPLKPVMSTEAASYPKLLKIYKELNRQNGIIFDAERERNALELECDRLKGFARLTRKGELQSKIDRKNEEIDLLKIGLSGIAKRYGFKTVHDFYKTFAVAKTVNAEYQEESDRWEELYGENTQRQEKESIHRRLQNYQKESTDRQSQQSDKSRNREAR